MPRGRRSCPCRAFPSRLLPLLIWLGRAGETSAAKVRIYRVHISCTLTLVRIIIDASARRFQAKRIYLRAVAAVRWSNTRNAILQGEQPNQGHAAQLQQADITLRTELAAITDARIITDFRNADTEAGFWLQDDPPRATILEWIRSYLA